MSRRSRKRRNGAYQRSCAQKTDAHWIDQVGVWLLAVTAVVLPIAFDPRSTLPFPITKAGVLGVTAYALGATLSVKFVVSGFASVPRTWLIAPPAVYVVLTAVAALFAVDTNIALWGSYDRRLGLVSTVQMGVIFVAAATFVYTRVEVLTVLAAVAVGGTLVAVYGTAQRLGLDPIRWPITGAVFATFGNSNIMGQYFAVLAAASLAGLLSLSPLSRRRASATALTVLSIAFVGGVVLSGARAALIGLTIGSVAALGLTVSRLTARRRRTLAAGLAVAVITVGSALVLATPLGARMAALAEGTDLSVSERALLYRTIFEVVADRPVLGVGPDNLAAVYNQYRPVEALTFGQLVTQSSAHGWPFRALLDTGVVGLLAFVAIGVTFVAAAAQTVRRSDNADSGILTVLGVALLTFLAAGVFAVNDLGTDWLFWLVGGMLVGTLAGPRGQAARRLSGWRTPVAAVLAAGLLWPVLGLSRDIGASRALLASRTLAERDPTGALAYAREVVEYDDRWPDHWNSLGLRALQAGDRDLALSAFERAASAGPYDPQIWTNLGKLQALLSNARPGLADRARASAARAVMADPRNPVAHAGATQIYLILGDNAAAAEEAEAALALAPRSDVYLELAAVAFTASRRLDEALRAIQEAISFQETSYRRLVLARIYATQANYPAARTQLSRALQLDPGNRDAALLMHEIADR